MSIDAKAHWVKRWSGPLSKTLRNVTRVVYRDSANARTAPPLPYGARVATISRDGKRVVRVEFACLERGCDRAAAVAGRCRPCYQAKRRAAGKVDVPPATKRRAALGRGVCSSCSTIAPLFAAGAKAKCRECLS